MASARSSTRRGAFLAVAVAVAVGGLTLGAGPAGATAASARQVNIGAVPASGVAWRPLGLINDWVSARTLGTGNPSWATQDGVVYLSGSIRNSKHDHSAEFAVLPPAARPAHRMYIMVSTEGGLVGYLRIEQSGLMSAVGPEAGGFTSLAGLSFPARSTRSHALVLQNGWASGQARWDAGAPSYQVSGGVVYLSGSVHGGTSLAFATLPPDARPANDLYITVYTSGAAPGIVHVDTDGTLEAYFGSATSFTSLAGISFPVASASSHPLTTLNNWTGGCCGAGNPAYLVRHGIVYLTGSLSQPGGSDIVARLPASIRPAHKLFIKVDTVDGTVGTVFIEPGGNLEAYSLDISSAKQFTSLASISYPVNS